MQRERVIDRAADFFFAEVGFEGVAVLNPDDILIVDVETIGFFDRGDDFGVIFEELVIEGGVAAAAFGPGCQMRQFDRDDGGLEGVDAGVEADFLVVILNLTAMNPQALEAFVQLRIVGRYQPPSPAPTEVFAREKLKQPMSP